MYKILFVCHGNICRSPMAEFIFNDMLKKQGVSEVIAESAATSAEELGNGVHPGTRRILNRFNIDCSAKRARQITKADFSRFDLIIGMDGANIRNINRLGSGNVHRLLDFTDTPRDVADPWYTGDFETTYNDIINGCEGIIRYLKAQGII